MRLKLFTALLTGLFYLNSAVAAPCDSDAHQQFDFWLGQWSVTTASGQNAGTNSITKDYNNCVITENWKSATPGFKGTSLNFYHPRKNQWQQLWLDTSGTVLELTGNLIDGNMVLRTADLLNSDGRSFFHEITWSKLDDGKVSQHWRQRFADGDEATIFLGTYSKLGQPQS